MTCNQEVVTGRWEATPFLRKFSSPLLRGTEIASAVDIGRSYWVNLEHVCQGSHTHFLKFLSSSVWEILCRYNKFILNQMGCLICDSESRANKSTRFYK